MSEEDYTICIICWHNESERKGMVLDAEGHAMAYDYRNIDEQLQETGCHEGHLVAVEVSWRNGFPLARMLHAPTVQEDAEWRETLESVHHKNQLEQELRKEERRGYTNSRGQRGTSLFVR